MASLWFGAAPRPAIDDNSSGRECRAVVVGGGLIWAVVQQPVEPQQLRREIEWESMPEALLRVLETRLDPDHRSPAVLPGDVDLDLPFDVQRFVPERRLGWLLVDGALLLSHRVLLGRLHADVVVVGRRWLLAVHPASAPGELVGWGLPAA